MLYTCIFSVLCSLLCALGAGIVFIIKKENRLIDSFLHAFASGVMIASSIFSLLIPAVDYCDELGLKDYIILPSCFLFAGSLILLLDFFTKKKTIGQLIKQCLLRE